MDFRTYVTLEATLTRRLLREWHQKSGPIYGAIARACKAGNWNGARRLATELDMTAVGTENREWIKYLLLSFASFGAGMVTGKKPSFVGVGSFDWLLNQTTNNFLQYLELVATPDIQEQALQLIAQDEASSKAQKAEFDKGSTQIDIPLVSDAAQCLNRVRAMIQDADLMAHGKDESNHVTVRWGLEGSAGHDLDGLRAFIAGLQPFEAELTGIEIFPPGKHSEGSCPVVARVNSLQLNYLHDEIAKHAPFCEQTFNEYKPHATLAYVKPEAAEKYRDLPVSGKFRVSAITISHRSGVEERVPFGITVQKFNPYHDEKGRFSSRTMGQVMAEMDALTAVAEKRRSESKDEAIRALRPSGLDWMTEEEITQLDKLQREAHDIRSAELQAQGFSSEQEAAKARVEAKRKASMVANKVAEAEGVLAAHQASGKSDLERRILVDAQTGETVTDLTGERDRVELPSVAGMLDKKIIDMHTHPDTSSFSDGDWGSFAWAQVQEMRVVGKDNVFTLRKGKEWEARPWQEHTPAKVKQRWNELTDKYLPDHDVDETMLLANQELAKEMGAEFEVRSRTVKKADTSGRYVTPFVSFDEQGNDKLMMISSLNASRLATWGFTAECEARGIERYKLTAVLDGRTSKFCRLIDGKEFEVADARAKVVQALEVQNPEDLRTVQPWPKQTRSALEEFKKMSPAELRDRGLHIPPFHPNCRTTCRLISKEIRPEKPEISPDKQAIPEQQITPDTLKELGITATPEQIAHWNAYIGLSPMEMLAKMTGLTPAELMTGALGGKPIKFFPNGDIGIGARGIMDKVKYSVGTVLDPYTGSYYLTQADLIAGDELAEKAFLRRLYTYMIESGESMGASQVVVAVAGNAYTYAKLGFLPTPVDWQQIRMDALEALENGHLKPLLESLDTDQKVLIQHLLQSNDEHALAALAELQIDYQGKTVGEWILEGVSGNWGLDLSNSLAVDQAKEYLL